MDDISSERPAEEFDPYSFAERWFEEHPEVLDKHNSKANNLKRRDEQE